jgi:hypothetical protein
MSDETFAVALGGRQWVLPHLPFRAIKKIQPILFQLYADLSDASPADIARFSEMQLERLAEAAYLAVATIDKDLTREAFFDLPFSVGELMMAFPSVARAAGLRPVDPDVAQAAAPEAPRAMGESISTA